MNNNYFMIIPPGLEAIALDELQAKSQLSGRIVPGGIELQGQHLEVLTLNSQLKIPSRILWRIEKFRCRDFPKLFKKVQKIEWNNILITTKVSVHSSATHSRLFDSRRIEQSFMKGLSTYFKRNTPPKKNLESSVEQRVYLRIVDDNLMISVDTSGEHLHFRGYRTSIGEAPLRENLAAACAFAFKKYLKPSHLIIDPLCGSGTLLTELALIDSSNSGRGFIYDLNEKYQNVIPNKMIGSDLDDKTIQAARDNASRAELSIEYTVEDLFYNSTQPEIPKAIISNLPYGIRIETSHKCQDLCKQIIRKYDPDLFGLVAPKDEEIKLNNYKRIKSLSFANGGIDVSFHIFINSGSN